MKLFTFASVSLLSMLGLWLTMGLVGCSDSAPTDPTSTSSSAVDSADAASHDDHDHDHGAMEAGLEKLSEADREAAMAQHICPVTGEMLGTMGTPIKVSLEDQDIWVCCKGCVKKATEDPEKYLAKLAEHSDHASHEDHKEGDHAEHQHEE